MDKTQEAHFSALLRYLKGDECKLRSYLEPLPYCVNAFDVVYKVIRPIYMNEYGDDITSESIRKKAFYGPLAALASNVVPGRPVKAATLYYHICENVGSWEKSRREKLEDDRKNCVDVRVTRRNDGSADVCLRIPAEQVPAGLMEMLGRIVGLGYASMREKVLKHFDARGADRMLENIYTTADRRERQRHLMFDTTRSTVLVNTIWDDVEAGSTGRYKALVNDMARSTRLHQMLSLRANLEHIGNIRNLPKGDYSPAELKRLDRRYNEVVEGLGI